MPWTPMRLNKIATTRTSAPSDRVSHRTQPWLFPRLFQASALQFFCWPAGWSWAVRSSKRAWEARAIVRAILKMASLVLPTGNADAALNGSRSASGWVGYNIAALGKTIDKNGAAVVLFTVARSWLSLCGSQQLVGCGQSDRAHPTAAPDSDAVISPGTTSRAVQGGD